MENPRETMERTLEILQLQRMNMSSQRLKNQENMIQKRDLLHGRLQ